MDRNYGHILVADNGQSCVFVFDCDGKILFHVSWYFKRVRNKDYLNYCCFLLQVGLKNKLKLIISVAVGPDGIILVAGSRILVFSAKGDFSEEIKGDGKGQGRYGGIAIDHKGRILASRIEKGRSVIQVLKLGGGTLFTEIDSYNSKLRRPSGIALLPDEHVIVVDLGNDCIKKFRYW